MKTFLPLFLLLIFGLPQGYAELPQKNRSKDIPPTFVIGKEESYGPGGRPIPVIHHDKPVTKNYPKSKDELEEERLKNVRVYIK